MRSVLSSTGHSKNLPELSARMRHSSVSAIKEMMYLAQDEQKKGRDIVSLGVGIPYYPAPVHIHDHVKNTLDTKPDIDKYTFFTGILKLRELFAEESSNIVGWDVSADDILVTAGSMGALFATMLTLVDQGDEVILPAPYFPSYAEQVAIAQGVGISVPLKKTNTAYRLDIAAIQKKITKKTKAILINSPHNPSGAVFAKEDLIDLAHMLEGTSIYVITDEVYDYLAYDDGQYFNIASIPELWPRVVRCCSLSKKYGMMGWRLGYLHTNHDLLMHILKIHDASLVCAPHISQEAAIAAISGPQDVVEVHRTMLRDNRALICGRLDRLPDLFSYVFPHGTYYVFPKYSIKRSSIELAKRFLYEAGVVTVPGIGFGPIGEGHLRLSFGAPPQHINDAFDRIEKWWKNI